MKKRLLTCTVQAEEDRYVARCLEIEVASDGPSEAEALANLEEALSLYAEQEGWEPLLLPSHAIELTDDDRACIAAPPVGREIM
mgnify:CR=1 FL=1